MEERTRAGRAAHSPFFFFFKDTASTEIYTLSLHDALPISSATSRPDSLARWIRVSQPPSPKRSEEHTSELQSHVNLVCRLLLEQKKEIDLESIRTSNARRRSLTWRN